jgi:hypothetical protein
MSERRTDTGARAVLDAATDERTFQRQVVALARLCGYRLIYHTHDARRSPAGFPDLVLLRPGSEDRAGHLVMLELKTEHGRPTVDQVEWLAGLATVPGITVRLARPSDWPELEAIFCGAPMLPAEWRTE